MITVQKDNKQLDVSEEYKEIYKSLGYSIVNEEGKIVEAGHATSLAEIKEENNTLKIKYSELLKENEKLKKENSKLKKENEKLSEGAKTE